MGQFLLQSGANFISKWGRYYKVGHLLQNRAVLVSYLSEKRFWSHIKQIHSQIPCLCVPWLQGQLRKMGREQYFLLTDSVIFLWSTWRQTIYPSEYRGKLNFCYNCKLGKITPPPQRYPHELYLF